jgi:hypothetical protein
MNNVKNIEAFLDRLEAAELNFRYCRLCECILNDPVDKAVWDSLPVDAEDQGSDWPDSAHQA